MKYHINDKQEVHPCRAQTQCPFEHYDTQEEARMQVEEDYKGSRADGLRLQQINALNASIAVFRDTPLKALDASELAQTLYFEGREAGFDDHSLRASIALASILHAHQTRSNRGHHDTTPYIEHPLRNSLRLVRLGVKDQDVIVAAVLHDTVEDGARQYVKKFRSDLDVDEISCRQILSQHIYDTYGKKVQRLVESVTNDYLTDVDKSNMTQQDKNDRYYNHVVNNVRGDPDVLMVKLTDFIDNATGLYHNDVEGREEKTVRQVEKYQPLIQVFRDEVQGSANSISKKSRNEILRKLDNTEFRFENILRKYH